MQKREAAFVVLIRPDGRYYCVENRKGNIGVPGGKREATLDKRLWHTAKREFEEETGAPLVTSEPLPYIQFSQSHYLCRFYYAQISEAWAASLPCGRVQDPAGTEQRVFWGTPPPDRMRDHVRAGLFLINTLV